MRAVVLALALALAPALAGCTASDAGFGFADDALPAETYYKEYRELLAGEHHKDFPVPVESQAQRIVLVASLDTRDQGLPLPGAVPASLRITLLAPDGTALDEATLDARQPDATLEAEDVAPGRYLARVDGFGASQDVDGRPYGAEYLLSIEIRY